MTAKPIILFDGICNLCNAAVQFIIKHDPKKNFLFTSLQSEAGQQLLKQYKLPSENFNSFLLLQDDTIFSKSTAALKVASQLKSAWKLLQLANGSRWGITRLWIGLMKFRWLEAVAIW